MTCWVNSTMNITISYKNIKKSSKIFSTTNFYNYLARPDPPLPQWSVNDPLKWNPALDPLGQPVPLNTSIKY